MARRKRSETAAESSKEIIAKGKLSRAKKCMKTNPKKVHKSGKHSNGSEEKSPTKCPEQSDKHVIGREEKSPSKCSDESPSSQVQRSVNTKDGAQEASVLNFHSGKENRPPRKIKLQLFPIDAHTLRGLEKDGLHPYLELTLSPRKKVSSVLQHIHSKWGCSKIARGDPTLYPYDNSVSAFGFRWTASCNITISDIFVAIRAPSLFRLRYGWSSEIQNLTNEPPSPSTPGISCFPSEKPRESIISNRTEGMTFTGKHMFGLDTSFTMMSSSNHATDPPLSENTPPDGQMESSGNTIDNGSGSTFFSWDDGLTSLSIGGLLSEVSLKGKFSNHSKNSNSENANPTLWDDNLTNISIGGLFSEASIHDRSGRNHEQESTRNSNHDQPSVSIGCLLPEASSLGEGKRRAISQQPLPLISDSLHAFLEHQTDKSRTLSPAPPELSHSSILDAEDTCHAFSFRKRTTTSLKFLEQVSEEAEEEQHSKDEPKIAKGLCSSNSMGFNQDSSLGFSGIKWAESRVPFDFGLSSSSRKLINGDSISFGAVIKDLQENGTP